MFSSAVVCSSVCRCIAARIAHPGCHRNFNRPFYGHISCRLTPARCQLRPVHFCSSWTFGGCREALSGQPFFYQPQRQTHLREVAETIVYKGESAHFRVCIYATFDCWIPFHDLSDPSKCAHVKLIARVSLIARSENH